MKKILCFFTIVMILAILSGCTSTNKETSESLGPATEPANTLKPTETATALTKPTATTSPTETATVVPPRDAGLSNALYYLAGQEEESQIWRLGTDSEITQMTHESAGVESYSVSPTDGKIAFVSDNRLILMDNDGANRSLIADGHTVDPNMEDYIFHGFVSSPEFSPDGQLLAYGFDGLHLFNLATGEDSHILTNLGHLLGEDFVFAKEAYSPGPWSPDGSRLLIVMGYYEGSTLAVMDLNAAQPFTRLRSDGPVCCVFSWTADGKSVLVANPYFTTNLPGLWRFDANTGGQSVIVPGLKEDGSINYVGWPLQLDSGELYFFYVNQQKFSPDVGIPLTMVRSDFDRTHQTQVRPETFRISDVLWAQDGSAAVILNVIGKGQIQVILARTDGSPLQVLFEGERVRYPMWGP